MSGFNKIEYNAKYTSENYSSITLRMRKEDKPGFIAYCTKIGVKPTAYILDLVNADAVSRGEEPPFKRRIK